MAVILVNLVIAVTLLEGGFLVVRHRLTGRGLPPWRVMWNLLAGLLLVIALRFALGGADWGTLALCLAGAGIAHILDLRGR